MTSLQTSKSNNFWITLVGSLLVTTTLWFLGKPSGYWETQDLTRSLSQITALFAIVILSFQLVMISRVKILENIFGSLDKLFKKHQIVSFWTVSLAFLHVMLLMLSQYPNWADASIYVIPSFGDLPYLAGIIALWIFISSILFSMFIKLPHHIWGLFHRIGAVGMLLASYHAFFVSSDISRYLPLRLWIGALLITSTVLMLYRVIYYRLKKALFYVITDIKSLGDIIIIKMLPVDKNATLNQTNAQFAYFKLLSAGVSPEEHPFTITSRPGDEFLEIAVKKSGDNTRRFSNLKVDDKVEVKGPHGGFAEKLPGYTTELWIAGGIGITPFLNLTTDENCNYKLYFLAKSDPEDYFVNRVTKTYQKQLEKGNFSFVPNISTVAGRINIEKILQEYDLNKTVVRICGPQKLLDLVQKHYQKSGISTKALFVEDFNYFD